MVKRGEIYFVMLGPVVGREINQKQRPVVVLSINDINRKPLVVTVVPGTTKEFVSANMVRVTPTPSNGLKSPTFFACHQIRAIDHGRFSGDPVGKLSAHDLDRIQDAVMYTLGFAGRLPIRIEGTTP